MLSERLTSRGRKVALPPSAWIPSAACCPCPSSRAAMTTWNPRRESCRAVSSPMPRLEPVMTATRCVLSGFMVSPRQPGRGSIWLILHPSSFILPRRPPEPGQPLTEVPERPRDGPVNRPGPYATEVLAVAGHGRGNVTVLAVDPAPTVQGRTDRAPHRGRRALRDGLVPRRRGAKPVPFPDDPVGCQLVVGHVASKF